MPKELKEGMKGRHQSPKTEFKKGEKFSFDPSVAGKLGAIKRWGEIRLTSEEKRLRKNEREKNRRKIMGKEMRIKKSKEELLARKRFRNQRYKANKRHAIGSHTFEQWLELKSRLNNMCLCCKQFEPIIKLTEDHIIPLSLGGSDFIDNIQPLCGSCNTRKQAKFISYLPISNSNFAIA